MELLTETRANLLVVKVCATRIDASVAIQFKDKMRKASDNWAGRVVLDLGDVDFIDSSGLGAVVACYKQVKTTGQMELACLSETVKKLFSLTRMDQVMTIHETVEQALDAA